MISDTSFSILDDKDNSVSIAGRDIYPREGYVRKARRYLLGNGNNFKRPVIEPSIRR